MYFISRREMCCPIPRILEMRYNDFNFKMDLSKDSWNAIASCKWDNNYFVYARKADVFESQTGTIPPHEQRIMKRTTNHCGSTIDRTSSDVAVGRRTEESIFPFCCRPIGRPEGEHSCGPVNNVLATILTNRREPRSTRQ